MNPIQPNRPGMQPGAGGPMPQPLYPQVPGAIPTGQPMIPGGYPQPGAYPHGGAFSGAQPVRAVPGMPQPVVPGAVRTAQPARAAVAMPAGGPGGPAVRAKTKEEAEEERDLAEEAVRKAPPWLISAVIHLVLVIILALWMIIPDTKEVVRLDAQWAPVPGEQLKDQNFVVEVKEPDDQAETAITEAQPVADPMAAVTKSDTKVFEHGSQAVSDMNAPAIGSLLKGRQVGMKKALMAKYGGSPDGEKAVQLALAWLVKQQDKHSGGWKLTGPFAGGSERENTIAATAMALLAFQGNGVTHQTGLHKDVVARGWEYLLKEQRKDGEDAGNFYNGEGPHSHTFYTHSQATIASCEIYGMTRDAKFKGPAEKAVKFLIESQGQLGGWRYTAKGDSDLSVSGWAMMALQSARMAQIEVPQPVLDRLTNCLDKFSSNGGATYGYMQGSSESDAMTAEGLLCRQYLGWKQNEPQLLKGADFLLQSHFPNVSNRNVYYWYYGTQMFHHLEGPRWDRWNENMREMMIKTQKKSGAETGSWDPETDGHGREGGRLYTTCLSVYILEVYYRHLPLYSKIRL